MYDTKQDEHYANYGRARLNAEYTLDFFNFLIRILATRANVSGMGLQGLEDRIHSGRRVGKKGWEQSLLRSFRPDARTKSIS
jgi:hypothetical protein